ncbi:M48 family metalloprotease [Natronomonas sp.]|uniref:M48 family metalloprotease n=1 Tax=Natronomonas sp. TaxID=2184060 RepID=UPI002FC2D4B5
MRRLGLRLVMVLTGLALLGVYLLVAAAGYQLLAVLWDQRPNMSQLVVYFVVITLVSGYLSYRLGTAGLLRELDTRELTRREVPNLHALVDRLGNEFDVGDISIHVGRLDAPNALGVGTARSGVIVLDYGLFELLSAEEVEAVIAHELAHLENRDGLLQTLGYTVVRTVGGLLFLGLLPVGLLVGGIARSLSWLRGRPPRPLGVHLARVQIAVLQVVVLLLFGLTLVLRAHSRRREYAADDRAVKATGKPLALARALLKIERAATSGWGVLSPLYIHGDEKGLLHRLLATHPPLDERLERLAEKADRQPGSLTRR